jgi:TrmH family RNA methyltransferase
MIITSTQNPTVKHVVDLRESKARKASHLAVIDGMREIKRAKEAGVLLKQIFFCPKLGSFDPKAFKGVDLIEVNEHVFEKLAYGERHDGVIAVAQIKPLKLADLKLPKDPFIVILETVEKPGNLGAILRTCDGAGVDVLIISDQKTDIYNPNVIRASTGVVFSLPTVAASNQETLEFCQTHKMQMTGAFPEAKTIYTKANLKGPLAVVLGKEDQGLSEFWSNACTTKVAIPMKGKADSLNVSVSAAVLLYEALRQRTS